MKQILFVILTIIVVSMLLNQCRKPKWWPGRFFLWTMNYRHSRMTNWGLKQVLIEKVHKLAAIASEGKVCGIDYSATSVSSSRRTNMQSIKTGRVEIRHGSVSNLPFPDRMFELITAVETHYYWPELVADMRKVLRVLKNLAAN